MHVLEEITESGGVYPKDMRRLLKAIKECMYWKK
jgi:hypothetical protein